MIVYPAIDLLGGACVRLRQGDYGAVTRFSDDPLDVARSFARDGAKALHVVDLDGARDGRPVHPELVREIAAVTGLPVQVGGGIRSAEHVAAYLKSGVHRVLIGTAAVGDVAWIRGSLETFGPDRMAAAVDVRDGEVLTHGWLSGTGLDIRSVAESLRSTGFETVLYTDTRRDGMLTSADHAGTGDLVEEGFRVIAAGGVSSPDDVRRLREAGATGVVIGSALYRGRITIAEAQEASC